MKKLLFISLFFIQSFISIGQEIEFSQYYSSALYLNPAFAAVYVEPSLYVNYRSRIATAETQNDLAQASFILPVFVSQVDNIPRGGIGLTAYNQSSGIGGLFNVSGMTGSYAHSLSLNPLSADVLTFGVQVGYELSKVAFSELRWGSQYSPFFGYNDQVSGPVTEFDEQISNVIVNAGIMYYYNRERNFLLHRYSAFSGISVSNINRPNKSFSNVSDNIAPIRIKYHGAFEFKVKKFFVVPNILGEFENGSYQFNGGIYAWYSPRQSAYSSGQDVMFTAGAWYRYRDNFIFLVGLKYNSVTIKASYDMNENILFENNVNLSQNHYELSLQFTVSKDSRIRKLSNPLF